MAQPLCYVVGDTRPWVQVAVTNEDGSAFDLTTYTVTFALTPDGSATATWKDKAIAYTGAGESAAGGIGHYDFATSGGTLATAGKFWLWLKIYNAGAGALITKKLAPVYVSPGYS
jgi:hypothetical protein